MASRLTRGLARSDSEILLDEYLHGLGFWRKMIPKDGNCLFRIASEKLFGSQIFYECVKEMFESHHNFRKKLKVNESDSLFQYLSLLMRKDIKIFWTSSSEMKTCTSNNFGENVILCTVDDKHFDLVYTLEYVSISALCQSILYEFLYEGVFGVVNALDKSKDMMGVKTPSSPKLFLSSFNQFHPDCMSPMAAPYPRTFIAFPYKVAKSLSVDILRNVEYDAWLEVKKARTFGCSHFPQFDKNVPLPGDKCQVTLEGHGDLTFNAHIQEIQKDMGFVVVFVEGLGEKHIVQTDSIKFLTKSNQFEYYWRKRAKKKSCDGCYQNKSFFTPMMQMRYPLRTNRFNSADQLMTSPQPQEIYHSMKTIEEDQDDCDVFSLKERSCSEGHFRKEFRLDTIEDENTFFDLSPGDDEVLVEESSVANVCESGWNYATEAPEMTGSTGGCPMAPEGTNTDGVMNQHMVQYNLYTPQSAYMVLPSPNTHVLNYDNYPGSINFAAVPSVDVNGSDLPTQDVSTSRFFYNLGIMTYNNWLVAQNQSGQQVYNSQQQASVQTISSPSPYIYQSSTPGMYVPAPAPAMISPEFFVVANNDSYSNGGYVASISPHGGSFYYPAPVSPYIQVGTPVQYHSSI